MAQRLPHPSSPAAGAVSDSRAPRCAAADALRFWLTAPAWLTLLAVVVFACAFPALAMKRQFWPFVFGMVVLGLPHGALDHLAPLFLRHRRLTPQYLTLFVLGYAALVVVYLIFWHLAPFAALVVFLLFSWLHWGQGEAYFLAVFGGQPRPPTSPGRFLIWAVRGGLPIVLPPVAHPAAFAQVAGGILGWYGSRANFLLSPLVREIGLAVISLTLAAYLRQSWKLSRAAFRRDAGEVALLLVYFLLVPAILAVGVYFCVWHSARHIARLMLLDDADQAALAQGRIGRCVLHSAAQALPMTVGALGFLAGLWWWQGKTNLSVSSLVYLYLSLIAALTFPHFLLVLWMDRKEFGENLPHPIIVSRRGD